MGGRYGPAGRSVNASVPGNGGSRRRGGDLSGVGRVDWYDMEPRRPRPRPLFPFSCACLFALLALPVPAAPAAVGLATPSVQDAGRDQGAPHPEAEEAIGRLKSPFCPGLMLEVCPSRQAAELRDSIETLARTGVRSDSLVEWALAEYGEEWRAVPRTRGAGLFAWIIPPLALVAGVGAVFLALRHLRRDEDDEGDEREGPGLTDEEERRLARAMEELEIS